MCEVTGAATASTSGTFFIAAVTAVAARCCVPALPAPERAVIRTFSVSVFWLPIRASMRAARPDSPGWVRVSSI